MIGAVSQTVSSEISPAINNSIVLIVEDDRDLREALIDTLQALDWPCLLLQERIILHALILQ
jgi:hypothetical protein